MSNKELLELEEIQQVSIAQILEGTGISSEKYNNYREGKEIIAADDVLLLSNFFKVPASFFNKYNVHNTNSGTNSHSGPISTYNNHSNDGFYKIVIQLLLDKGLIDTNIIKDESNNG